jgi:hypothetical protein
MISTASLRILALKFDASYRMKLESSVAFKTNGNSMLEWLVGFVRTQIDTFLGCGRRHRTAASSENVAVSSKHGVFRGGGEIGSSEGHLWAS